VLSEVPEDGDWLEDEPANGTSGKPMTPVPRAVTPPTEGSVDMACSLPGLEAINALEGRLDKELAYLANNANGHDEKWSALGKEQGVIRESWLGRTSAETTSKNARTIRTRSAQALAAFCGWQ